MWCFDMEWKPYLGYADVMNLIQCSKKRAYDILDELRTKTGWGDTYEAKHKYQIVIPTDIFLKYFPSCRKALKK